MRTLRAARAASAAGALLLALPACNVDEPMVQGRWNGSYTCSQGLTGLTLEVGASAGATIPTTFSFHPLPGNPNVASGAFRMRGVLVERRFWLTAEEWIDQPAGYRTVDLDGFVSPDGTTFSGDVIGGSGCTTFFLTRRR